MNASVGRPAPQFLQPRSVVVVEVAKRPCVGRQGEIRDKVVSNLNADLLTLAVFLSIVSLDMQNDGIHNSNLAGYARGPFLKS